MSAGCDQRTGCDALADFGNSLFASVSTDPGFTLESAFGYSYTAQEPDGGDGTVPEPVSLTLTLLGAALLGVRRLRRMKPRQRRDEGIGPSAR